MNEQFYINEMRKVEQQKMFWVDQIQHKVIKNAFIVDFGAADGSLFDWLNGRELCTKENYVAIENNAARKQELVNRGLVAFSDLSDAAEYMSVVDGSRESILILSSVLHEIQNKSNLLSLIEYYLKPTYIVIRDMYCDLDEVNYDRMYTNYVERQIANLFIPDSAQWNLFQNIVKRNTVHYQVDNRSTQALSLKEYYLKYRYTDNMEREITEHYLYSFAAVKRQLIQAGGVPIYEYKYINQWIQNKIFEDGFDYQFQTPTHYELIIKYE